jgi:hypothetical protein
MQATYFIRAAEAARLESEEEEETEKETGSELEETPTDDQGNYVCFELLKNARRRRGRGRN